LNPRVVEAQLHGATAQGIGGALLEEIVYDADGQNRCATLLDYAIPTAALMPSFEVEHLERLDPNTPLGMKGMAEGGVMGASAAISNAVADALAPLGVTAGRQPFTARRRPVAAVAHPAVHRAAERGGAGGRPPLTLTRPASASPPP